METFWGVLTASATNYPGVTLLGFMTVALMMALILIGLTVRVIRGLGAAKSYEAAMRQIESIEAKLADMTDEMEASLREYDASLRDEKDSNAREVFALQQTIFERNAEILQLKTDILEMSHIQSYDSDPH
jgi:hypothetical protein